MSPSISLEVKTSDGEEKIPDVVLGFLGIVFFVLIASAMVFAFIFWQNQTQIDPCADLTARSDRIQGVHNPGMRNLNSTALEDRADEERRCRGQLPDRPAPPQIYWSDLKRGEHCDEYATRLYTAQLWNVPADYDWLYTCMNVPPSFQIHGHTMGTPTYCERNVSPCVPIYISR